MCQVHFLNKIEKFLCKKLNTLVIIRFQPVRLFDKFLVQPLKFLLFKDCQRIYNFLNYSCSVSWIIASHSAPFAIFCWRKIAAHLLRATSSFGLRPHSTQNPLFALLIAFSPIGSRSSYSASVVLRIQFSMFITLKRA